MSSFNSVVIFAVKCSYPFELLDDFLLGPLADEESKEKEAGKEQKEGKQQNSWWETRPRLNSSFPLTGIPVGMRARICKR
jgi:hypothetical protein